MIPISMARSELHSIQPIHQTSGKGVTEKPVKLKLTGFSIGIVAVTTIMSRSILTPRFRLNVQAEVEVVAQPSVLEAHLLY